MLPLDLRSITIMSALLALLLAGVIFLLRRTMPATIKGINAWAWGIVWACVGSGLISARGVLPDLLTMLLGNLAVVLGLLSMYRGLGRLLDLPFNLKPWLWGILLLQIPIAWLIYVAPSYPVYRFITAILPMLLFLAMAVGLLRVANRTTSVWLMLTVLFVQSGVIAANQAYHLMHPWAVRGLFDSSAAFVQSIYLLSYASTFLLLNIGFVLLVNDQIRVRLEASMARAQESEHQLQLHRDNLQELVLARTRDLVRARDAAEEASRAKSEFLASMSHELRTPLNAVLGHAQLLQLEEALPAPLHEQIDEIAHAGQHLLTLVNDLIDLARIEAGRIDLDVQPVALESLLPDCLAMTRLQAEAKGVELQWLPMEGESLIRVFADEGRLRQVVLNLLSNAIKYNRPGGLVQLYSAVRVGWIRVSVADTGEGIAPDKQQRLFTAFDRLGKECGQVEGTGIGLVISKRMIEAMGGRMGFESEVGRGSVFWLELPAL